MKKTLIAFIFLFLNIISYSQSPCATDEYNKPLIDADPNKYKQIEQNIQDNIRNSANRTKDYFYPTIPVVFHVIYQDSKENIPDSVIHQQIEVLNESFMATNSDTAILTDTLKNWVGRFGIRFELAYLDPDGNPTSGITRTKTNVPEYSYWGNYMKFEQQGHVAWPTNKYLNIWVCDLYGGLLGFAQFPGGPAETDGLVLDWQITGNQIYPWTYSSLFEWAGGRVGVHEVGHWLNLHHPWGDYGPCADDHIPETGLQDGPLYPSANCPDTLMSTCDPSERVFVKHYMDYCGNSCMVCFTKNQVVRGLASLETYRMPMIESYEPRPTINIFEETKINPSYTKGRLYMEFPDYEGYIKIEVHDMLGRKVFSEKTYQKFKHVYLNQPAGTYIITVEHRRTMVFKKKIVISETSPFGANFNKYSLKINDI